MHMRLPTSIEELAQFQLAHDIPNGDLVSAYVKPAAYADLDLNVPFDEIAEWLQDNIHWLPYDPLFIRYSGHSVMPEVVINIGSMWMRITYAEYSVLRPRRIADQPFAESYSKQEDYS